MMTFYFRFNMQFENGLCTFMDKIQYTIMFTIFTQKYVCLILFQTHLCDPLQMLNTYLFCYCRYKFIHG